ncbi:MAG: VOC family protein [Gammaproteobacteria bacterium]|nr:VOC family protein [Gammaproteobacteria bacterium]
MTVNIKINYIELPAGDIKKAKKFYADLFGWTFVDYGDDYCAFNDGATDGGFYRSDLNSSSANGAALVVLYASDLEAIQKKIEPAGGSVIKPIFTFPGGRRFHFLDPNQNELAVWSDAEAVK